MRKLAALILSAGLFWTNPAHAAITAATAWDLETGGSDANGGGFDSTIAGAGTDYATGQTTAHATLTTASTVGVTTTDLMVKAADYTVASTDVGNIIFITGGTATTGFYQIISATTGGDGVQKWGMDRSMGIAAQTCPGKMGGCRKLLSANSFFSSIVAGNHVCVKAGSYTMGGNMTSFTIGTAVLPILIEGYNTSCTDAPTIASGNQPIITSGSTVQFSSFNIVRSLSFIPSNVNGVRANTGPVIFQEVKSSNTSTNNAFTFTNSTGADVCVHCEAKSTSGTGFLISDAGSAVIASYIHDSTDGIEIDSGIEGSSIINNVFVNNSGTTIKHFASGQKGEFIVNNTLYGAPTPAGTGISAADTVVSGSVFMNNIIYGFITGVNWSTATTGNLWLYNDFFNNTTNRTNVTAGSTDIALDPTFTNAAGGDFSVGANMKAAGFPGAFPGGLSTTTSYTDIGAVQRQETGSAASTVAFISVGQ